eukprot:2818860-Rhodomonas_salina.4
MLDLIRYLSTGHCIADAKEHTLSQNWILHSARVATSKSIAGAAYDMSVPEVASYAVSVPDAHSSIRYVCTGHHTERP